MNTLQEMREKLKLIEALINLNEVFEPDSGDTAKMRQAKEILDGLMAECEAENAAYPMAELIARAVRNSKGLPDFYFVAFVKDGNYKHAFAYTEAGARHAVINHPRWVIARNGELIGAQETPN